MDTLDTNTEVFDSFDIDLVVKVLSNTLFSESLSGSNMNMWLLKGIISLSGPFFIYLVPIFYIFQGIEWSSPTVIVPAVYGVLLTLFCESQLAMYLIHIS
jgi:hypothetical protein